MDPWHIYAGLFNILLIEEGDVLDKFAKSDYLFHLFFVFISVLSFVHRFDVSFLIMIVYYLVKITIKPFFVRKYDNLGNIR